MDGDKISKALATARLRVAKREGSDPDEVKALEQVGRLYDTEAAAKKAVRDAQGALDLATLKKYGELTEIDVKVVVLDDKWRATVGKRVAAVVGALTLALVGRIQQLGDRYNDTVLALDADLDELEASVARHLATMGVE